MVKITILIAIQIPYYIIDPDEIRDINKPIVIKPQLKSRNVFDHASERVKKLVYSECMAEVPEQDFTRAEKAIRYMTNYVEERARNKTPRSSHPPYEGPWLPFSSNNDK